MLNTNETDNNIKFNHTKIDLNNIFKDLNINIIKDDNKLNGGNNELNLNNLEISSSDNNNLDSDEDELDNSDNLLNSSNFDSSIDNLNLIEKIIELKVGDLVKIKLNNDIIIGNVIFTNQQRVEIIDSNGICVIFDLENIDKLTDLVILERGNFQNYIDFMNLKLNTKIKLISKKNSDYNNCIGIIDNIDGNLLQIRIISKEDESTRETIYLDVKNGLSEMEDIEKIEILDDIIDTSEISTSSNEIEFIDGIEITLLEEINLLENSFKLSNIEMSEILTNQLINLLDLKNKFLIQDLVSNFIDEINILSEALNKDNLNNEKTKSSKISNKYIKELLENKFKNKNIIPVVEIKNIYFYYSNDIELQLDDNFHYKSFLKSIYQLVDILKRDQTNNIITTYDNYLREIIESDIPNYLLNKGYGYTTNLKENIELEYKFNDKIQNTKRFLGEMSRPLDKVLQISNDNSFNQYIPNYWETSNYFKKNIYYEGDNVNIIGLIISDKKIFNFDISSNKIYLSELVNIVNKLNNEIDINNLKKIKINEVENNLNYKHYKNNSLFISFEELSNLSINDYINNLNKIFPSLKEIININKNLKSINDIEKILYFWGIDFNTFKYKEVKDILNTISQNNSNSILKKSFELIDEFYKLYLNRDISFKDELIEEMKDIIENNLLKEVTGEYISLNKDIDSNLSRFEWINQEKLKDLNIFILKEVLFNQDNKDKNLSNNSNKNLKNRIESIIKNVEEKINIKYNEINQIVENDNNLIIYISIVFKNKEELKDNIDLRQGIYGCLIIEDNCEIYKLVNITGINKWVLNDSFSNKSNNLDKDRKRLLFNYSIASKKQNEVMNIWNKSHTVNYDHNEKYNNLDLTNINKVDTLFSKINTLNLDIYFLEDELKLLKTKLDMFSKNDMILNNFRIDFNNIRFLNSNKKEDIFKVNAFNNQKKISKLKKKFDQLTLIEDKFERDTKINKFISNKLRIANHDEDNNFLYDLNTNEKIAPYDWILEIKINLDPEHNDFHIENLISNYSTIVEGNYVSIIDGRIFMSIQDDDFMGYDNDQKENNQNRQLLVDNYNDDLYLQKIKLLEKNIVKYKLNTDLNILIETFLESNNNPNPISNQDKYLIYKIILKEIDIFEQNKQNLLKKKLKEKFFQKYKKNFDPKNINDKKKIYDLFNDIQYKKYYIQLVAIFIIIIQTSFPKYPIKKTNDKNIIYSIYGAPYLDLNYEQNNILKYFCSSLERVLQPFNFKNSQNMFNMLISEYKYFYNQFEEIRKRYKDYDNINKRFDLETDYNKFWYNFRPNRNIYIEGSDNISKFLFSVDEEINNNKIFINKFSVNCCLDNIKNYNFTFFQNFTSNKIINDNNLKDKKENKIKTIKIDFINNNNNNNYNYDFLDIYPLNYTDEIKYFLFQKYTDNGKNRYINNLNGKCYTTGIVSKLFINKEKDSNDEVHNYNKLINNFNNYMKVNEGFFTQKIQIGIKENIDFDNNKFKKILNEVNKKNEVKINIGQKLINSNLILLDDLYKVVSNISNFDILKHLFDEINNIYFINFEKNYKQNNYLDNDIFSLYENKLNDEILKSKKYIFLKIRLNDNNSGNLDYINDFEEDSELMFLNYKKNIYKDYFLIILINISKLISNNNYNLEIPSSWKISPDTLNIIKSNYNFNNLIFSLSSTYMNLNNKTIEMLELIKSKIENITNILNKFSFYYDDSLSKYKNIENNFYFSKSNLYTLYKFIFYNLISYFLRETDNNEYNTFIVEFLKIIFNNFLTIKNTLHMTKNDIINNIKKRKDLELQAHLSRQKNMSDDQKKIDREFKKYGIGDFYSKKGKQDWERGLAIKRQDTEYNSIIQSGIDNF